MVRAPEPTLFSIAAQRAAFDDAARDIAATVLEQGSLDKAAVIEAWGLTESDYATLQVLLAADGRVVPGPKGRGGFIAHRPAGRLPEAGDEPILRTAWERQAVERLVELLQHRELEDQIGDLLHTLRQVRKQLTGEDRRGTKRELATALVLQHGLDLFQDPPLRRLVARVTKVAAPRRWHPGKPAAADFVRDCQFPSELAGLPSSDTAPHFEYFERQEHLGELRDFQREVLRKLMGVLYRAGSRAIVTLPTGGGKTRVAVEGVGIWLQERHDAGEGEPRDAGVIWLAHTEELCEQACECFKQVWTRGRQTVPLLLVRFWGGYTSDAHLIRQVLDQSERRPTVFVSTPNRLVNLLARGHDESEVVLAQLRASVRLIVIDEAHRAAASSYRSILAELAGGERAAAVARTWDRTRVNERVSVVGLTATPFRMEYVGEDPEEGTRELREVFGELIEPAEALGPAPRARLETMGVLARPRFETLETGTRMRLPDVPGHGSMQEDDVERLDRVMAVRADNSPRRLVVLERLREICADPGSAVLYFGPSVRDAECMAFLLRRFHIHAGVVSGRTRTASRRQLVDEFKEGRIQVLCNCEVLTTGFDAPRVSHVVMARPTVSRVLYEQIVGRGLRGPLFGGTESCTIVDCHDDIRGDRPELGYEAFRRVWTG